MHLIQLLAQYLWLFDDHFPSENCGLLRHFPAFFFAYFLCKTEHQPSSIWITTFRLFLSYQSDPTLIIISSCINVRKSNRKFLRLILNVLFFFITLFQSLIEGNSKTMQHYKTYFVVRNLTILFYNSYNSNCLTYNYWRFLWMSLYII